MKLREKLLVLGVGPLLGLAIVTIFLCRVEMGELMQNEAKEDLEAAARLEYSSMSFVTGDEFSVDSEGNMVNGSYNITEDVEVIDEVSQNTGVDVTVFYGDTRYATSVMQDGERVLGTKASDVVVEKVLKKGETYFATGVDVVGEKYYAYYLPIYNSSDETTPVGMIFAGKSQEKVTADINKLLVVMFGVTVAAVLCCAAAVVYLAFRMSNRLRSGVSALEQIAQGDLAVEIDRKMAVGKDETAEMLRALLKLKEQLGDIVSGIIKTSDQVEQSATELKSDSVNAKGSLEQVEKAIAEVAEGATSQAADTQAATEHVMIMGERVEKTNSNVLELTKNADTMEDNGLKAKETLKELESINGEVQQAIDTIYEQTNTTNESAQRISEAINLITSIAEETNLLSLNATIEAARAGEQGRGFAVVASQIQKLAEQSNESANQIGEYIRSLMADSENAVATMENVKTTMQRQSSMIEKTDEVFYQVMDGIQKSRDDISKIAQNTKELDASRVSVVDIVQGLSAVAEEYAASTEETSAATAQVNNTVQDITDRAGEMQEMAVMLKDSVSVFKVQES